MEDWNWLRLATVVAGIGAGVASVLAPATAGILGPLAGVLLGIAVRTPGFTATPKDTK
jgi:hypothetical protein